MELLTAIVVLAGTIVNWIGFLIIISMIVGVATPLIYHEESVVNMKIRVKNFTLIHITKDKDKKAEVSIFHKHEEIY